MSCCLYHLHCPVSDLNLSEDQIEDMWLGVSVASQGRPGGRFLVSLCSHWLIKLSLVYMFGKQTNKQKFVGLK